MADVTDTKAKVNVALRYIGSNATGALTLAVALGAISPDQSADVIKSLHVMYSSTQDFVGAFANVWYIVFPLIALWLGKLGINSAGFGAIVDRLLTAAKAGNTEAQIGIIKGTTALATGEASPAAVEAQKAIIAATATIAQDASIPKSTEAKAALIDAVAAQQEVVGSIAVTDQAIVDATQSAQVRKVTKVT